MTLNIFPYLLAIFIAVKAFQASGAFDLIQAALAGSLSALGIPPEVLSVAIIKPLSGSASTALLPILSRPPALIPLPAGFPPWIIGSAETTFYVLAVYLGAVGIRKTKSWCRCVSLLIHRNYHSVVVVRLNFEAKGN